MEKLELQLINNIIMYSRPTYPYVAEIKEYSAWYDGEDAFHEENKIRWVFDAIKLKREIRKEYLAIKFRNTHYSFWIQDIAGNYL